MLLDFQKTQQEFTRRIRQGDKAACPKGISEKRMQVYQDCFFFVILDFINNAFPVLKSVSPDDCWQHVIQDFYERHHSKSPLFDDIPQEFLMYLLEEHEGIITAPFASELAHYEWMRFALKLAEGTPFPQLSDSEAKQQLAIAQTTPSKLTMSPTAEVVAYHYPVHTITHEQQLSIKDQGEYFFCIYRNPKGIVNYIEINAYGCQLLLILKEKARTLAEATQLISLQQNSTEEVPLKHNRVFIETMMKNGILASNNTPHT